MGRAVCAPFVFIHGAPNSRVDLFLDIETVPDFGADEYLELRNMYERGDLSKSDGPTYWKYLNGALSPFEGRVALITYQTGDLEPVRLKEWECGEQTALERFYSVVSSLQKGDGRIRMVGHNIASFDIPFLYQRMLACKINDPKWLYMYMIKKPAVADLLQMHLPSNKYQSKGLKHDVLAHAYDLPTKSTSGKDEVLHYFEQRYDLILDYSEREFVYPQMFACMERDGIVAPERLAESVRSYGEAHHE